MLTEWNLTPEGACAACGTPCAGRFQAAPGTWGSRRLPVRLRDFAVALENEKGGDSSPPCVPPSKGWSYGKIPRSW